MLPVVQRAETPIKAGQKSTAILSGAKAEMVRMHWRQLQHALFTARAVTVAQAVEAEAVRLLATGGTRLTQHSLALMRRRLALAAKEVPELLGIGAAS